MLILLGIIFTICCCENQKPILILPKSSMYEQYYYLDVIGDRFLDTLIIRSNRKYEGDKDIIIVRSGVEERIITCATIGDGHTVPDSTEIQSIILSRISPFSKSKTLRITYLNIDTSPEYVMIDLQFMPNLQWYVKKCYLCNTDDSYCNAEYILSHTINKTLDEEYPKNREVSFYEDIGNRYFLESLKKINRQAEVRRKQNK